MIYKRYFLPLIIVLMTLHAAISYGAIPTTPTTISTKLATLETKTKGRIGVYAINSANQDRIEYRSQERFPLCSTAKLMAVAALLKQTSIDKKLGQKIIHYNRSDLVPYSPVTQQHIQSGMTLYALCAAAIMQSDNTAMNYILKQLGGLQVVNTFARTIGDDQLNLSRLEPALNTAIPGDQQDTSTPQAMATSLQRLALGDVLSPENRHRLKTWLIKNQTGDHRIRAGSPKHWMIGDKTGTGAYGTTNDIAILWPKGCAPITLALFFTQSTQDAPARDDVLQRVAQWSLQAFAQNDRCIQNALRH